ncbi:MAG TPA: sulfite exporter TauE/SafE family protein [Xanthobacteraceae bacterium]
MTTFLILIAAAFIGGALNSLAGGGTLVTFPALLFAGLNPIDANASSVVALFPGTFAGAWAYRRSILTVAEFSLAGFLALSLVGGLVGALLLLFTPVSIFASLVPWLILFATLVFAAGNFAPLKVIQRIRLGRRGALAALFVIAIYGGYFGGGIGFLMLAAFTLFGMRDINAMNGLKMALVGLMTVAAIVAFIVADVVRWPQTLPMLASSVIGSYAAAHWAQRLDQRLVKAVVIVLGTGLTAYFLWRGAL